MWPQLPKTMEVLITGDTGRESLRARSLSEGFIQSFVTQGETLATIVKPKIGEYLKGASDVGFIRESPLGYVFFSFPGY